ncbi:MAG TPA: PAS domain S-box protein, partial [Verrucomicrobiae bacterium]|nr:PAS domain S-box protein [Verrucomicrobiae bacterium]
FIQDDSAGIFVGNGEELPVLTPGDVVEVEGASGPGEFAPIVQPTAAKILGHTHLPQPARVNYEELVTGREDSQWVEVSGLVRAVFSETSTNGTLEIFTGGGRLTAFVPGFTQSDPESLVDSEVRIKGVCGTWINKQRQLFGFRLMVPHREDIYVEADAPTNALAKPAQPIGNLLRFRPKSQPYERRAKVIGTVILHQEGRALFVEDELHGLYVQTRQPGRLQPGDRVELLGFPVRGNYTPILEDGVWQKVGSGPEPAPTMVNSDEALSGLQDSRLVAIEGRLLNRANNNNESVLLLEADNCIFSARLESPRFGKPVMALQNGSRLRLTGVCQIEVGDIWRSGPAWRAKAFQVLLRSPADIQVLQLPPWWTLTRLLWAVGILITAVLASLAWAAQLRRKVGNQTTIIRKQLEVEARLKERYEELFENANDMIYMHDLSGRITSLNLAGERLLGRNRHFVIQSSLLEFIAEEQRLQAGQWLDHIVDGTAPAMMEWDFVNALGGRVRLEISTRLIEREGRHVEVEGIARDVTEHRRLEKEILEISTREQRRLGHDLHDGVCQQLAGIGFLSDNLAGKLREQDRPEAAEAQAISKLVNNANKQTRGVARGLFPVRLEENGLLSALQELAQDAGAFFNTRCEFYCDKSAVISDHTVALHLYYIAHEAILNAVKHGKAQRVEVRLAAINGDDCLLTVRNDGTTLTSLSAQGRGMGIRIMKYRARMIGATVIIQSSPSGGTEVLCQFTREPKRSEIPL